MGHYKSNLRDIEFNLFEVLGRDDVLGTGPFEEYDVATAPHATQTPDVAGHRRASAAPNRAAGFAYHVMYVYSFT